jgi:hypothetical protein
VTDGVTALPFTDLPDPEPRRLTEADVLTALRARYSQSYGNGDRWVFATHVRCAPGFGPAWGAGQLRTADAVAMDLWPSAGLEVHGHEVKVSRGDWLTELKQPDKCEPVKRYCDRWWLVVSDRAIVKPGELPAGWGLMVVAERSTSRWNAERCGYDVAVERYARVAVRAPKLVPEPIGRDFLAPLLRAAVRTARAQ